MKAFPRLEYDSQNIKLFSLLIFKEDRNIPPNVDYLFTKTYPSLNYILGFMYNYLNLSICLEHNRKKAIERKIIETVLFCK